MRALGCREVMRLDVKKLRSGGTKHRCGAILVEARTVPPLHETKMKN
jgi:hypothetical protein